MRAERPEDSAVTVARIYLLLAQDQLDEAWKLALAFRGPDSYEVLDRVGTVALDRVVQNPLLNPDTRGKIIETGLMAETMAMEADPHRYEAPLNKSVLLLQKSKLTSDPAERQALLAEMRQMIQVYARIRNIPVPGEGRPPQ
jgi:hypothetical protein